MKVDISLAMTGPEGAAERAAELAATGADGLFTFENSHDVFFPLVLASTATAGTTDLMTNVAMAFPRSPLHMAYAANDMQLLNKGGFRLGPGLADPPPHPEALRRPLGQAGGADARDGRGREDDPRPLRRRGPVPVRGRVHDPHPHDPELQPGPQPLRQAHGPRGRPRPEDVRDDRRGRRRHPRHAVQLRAPLRRAHPAGRRPGPREGGPHPRRPRDRARGHLRHRHHRRGDRGRRAGA